MSEGLTVFWSSVSSNLELKKHQQKIWMVLDSKKIPYDKVDIATSDEGKLKMKELCGDTARPPQIIKGNTYIGDFNAFDDAVECETLPQFLNPSS